MTFLWPEALVSLAAVPLLVALYVIVLRRRQKAALRYASLDLVKAATGAQTLRRHIPPALFLLAIVIGFVALARPTAVILAPSQYETVMLAIDVSLSMSATDVNPNRITAAQEAAKAFVAEQPRTTRIGVVAFGGSAALVQPPTQNREDLLAAIDRVQLQRATAIGSGMLVALKTIFPEMDVDLTSASGRRGGETPRGQGGATPYKPMVKPVPPGSFGSAVIILLTDGQNTAGPHPIEVAKLAADRGVRVYTVGIGTPGGKVVTAEGWSIRVRLDEETLKQVASITRAEYFFAGDAAELKKIYHTLHSRFTMERKQTEVTALFSAAATLLALLSALLSLLWFHRIL